jgi:hypothetical protein
MTDDIQPDYAQCKPELAYEAYSAMRQREAGSPQLRENPYWNALVDTAYARFYAVWKRAE